MSVSLAVTLVIIFLGTLSLVIGVVLAFLTLGNIENREREKSLSMGAGAAWSCAIALLLLIIGFIAGIMILGSSIEFKNLRLLVTDPRSLSFDRK